MFYVVLGIGSVFIVFYITQLLFVKNHLKWSRKPIWSDRSDKDRHVTVIHPIKGLDHEFMKNLESWMNQDYQGIVQHIFSFQEENDPAILVVKELIKKYPEADMEIIVNPIIDGLNGKSSNMVHGIKKAKYNYLIFGDSDIRVAPDFIVKMVRPLEDEDNGVTTCGQINIGGRDFWTRFFTYLQNSETDFHWAFLTRLGMDVGITGAAFGMRKKLIEQLGGLESYGSSLLEDMHLGNTLFKMNYNIVLGPFVECHVDKIEKEKTFNYAKRITIGLRTHVAVELPAFIIILFWYWAILIWSLITLNPRLILLSFIFLFLRAIHGVFQRVLTMNKVMPVDMIMPLMFDLMATFYLLYSQKKPKVTWRGITYEIKKGGYIEDLSYDQGLAEETVEE